MPIQVYERTESVAAANQFASALSVIGCICIFVYFVHLKDARKFLQRILMYLTLCNFWYCVATLLGDTRIMGAKCFVQAAMTSYFGLAAIMWTGILGLVLRELTEKQNYRIEDLELFMVLIAFGVPAVLTLFAYAVAGFGPAHGRCWIVESDAGHAMRMLCFYIPLWITIGYSIWVYGRIRRHVRSAFESFKDGEHTSVPLQFDQLALFPLAFGFCWFSSSTLRILQFFAPGVSFPMLEILSVSTGSLQGFVNAVLCGFAPEFRRSSRCGCGALRRRGSVRAMFSSTKKPRVSFANDPPEVLGQSYGFPTYDPSDDPELGGGRDDSSSESSAERFGTLEFDAFAVEDRGDDASSP
jgi:hypothetical protein